MSGKPTAGLPMRAALVAVAGVWVLGCVWSYTEQSAFAADRGFVFPHLLPLVIDGFAAAMAGVAWAASLDGRPALPARLATLVAVAGSAASNGVWAWLRTDHDRATVVLAVAVPVAANLAFEVLLAELRRQVQRRRGLPAPVALPTLRVIRLVLAPASTFRAWRRLVLDLTDPTAEVLAAPARSAEAVRGGGPGELAEPIAPAERLALPALAVVTAQTHTGETYTGEYHIGELELPERARRLVNQSPVPIGRRRLAELLEVSEHQARQLLDQIDDDANQSAS